MEETILRSQEVRTKVDIGRLKRLDMSDFAEQAVMSNINTCVYLENYFAIFGANVFCDVPSNTIILAVPSIYYAKEKYHKYVVVVGQCGQYELSDKIAELKPNSFLIRATKIEGFEKSALDSKVLASIKQAEEQASFQTLKREILKEDLTQ